MHAPLSSPVAPQVVCLLGRVSCVCLGCGTRGHTAPAFALVVGAGLLRHLGTRALTRHRLFETRQNWTGPNTH